MMMNIIRRGSRNMMGDLPALVDYRGPLSLQFGASIFGNSFKTGPIFNECFTTSI